MQPDERMQPKGKENEESQKSYLEYIKENMVGLFLILLSFFIIYVVDRIAMYNTALATMVATMPPVPMIPTIPSHLHKKKSSTRKHLRR